MQLKQARKLAIEQAKSLPDGATVEVYRIGKRQFDITGPGKLVYVAYATWAKDGWYEKYPPGW